MRFTHYLLAWALLLAPSSAGCGAALPVIAAVVSAVSELLTVLNAVEAKVPGAVPADLQAALTEARDAAKAVQAARESGDAALYADAVEHALRAYQRVLDLSRGFGVRAVPMGARMGAAPRGAFLVPSAAELGARLREQGR